ncbi:unnamed protein product [Cyclocybe aegerita]|uniref:Phosphomethylpyrimidine kinase n=1 Tax=Cyclocybe aegerita TaxID=1973307 RepID=A0A8S0W3H2_CYCAE|nr:unnamed protein product [Cyclocybe aegerita]
MTNTNIVLSIAGSDPSGGAGIQADLKTFAANGCYGASVITALTAQNTTGVQGVFPCPPNFVEEQINSVLADLDVKAIKTGMLYDAEVMQTVVSSLKKCFAGKPMPHLVVDPVCVSTSGHSLLDLDALAVMISELLPLASVITPNKSEAELLLAQTGTKLSISTLEDMLVAAEKLLSVNCGAVLVKGGHIISSLAEVDAIERKFPKIDVVGECILGEHMEILLRASPNTTGSAIQLVVDVLVQQDGVKAMFVHPRIESTSTHGTGCTLSSAIACELAKGVSLEKAIGIATMYTHLGIQTASPIGKGHGPLNHLHSISSSLVPLRTPENRYPFAKLLIQRTSQSWKGYVQHEFVIQLGKGVLDRNRFAHFIKQDYHYLKYYARAYALLAAKSASFKIIETSTQTILNVLHEIGNHKTFCEKFNISEEELENTPESVATTAYGAFILDTGIQGDVSKLTMALMACLLGYGEVGLWLKKQSEKENSWVVLDGNPYKHWMDEYAGEMYQNAVQLGLETVEAIAQADQPSAAKLKEWIGVWEKCTRLEKGFWDMAMNLSP